MALLKKITFSILFAMSAMFTVAQENIVYIDYNAGFPVSSLKDYIGDNSYRGLHLELAYFTTENITFGISGGYNSFYEKTPRQTYEINEENFNGAINATQWSYHSSSPIQLNVGYYLFDNLHELRPFASLGIGASYIEEYKVVGMYSYYKSDWAFSLNPAIGLTYQIPESTIGFNTRVSYYYNNYESRVTVDPSYMAISVGVTFYP